MHNDHEILLLKVDRNVGIPHGQLMSIALQRMGNLGKSGSQSSIFSRFLITPVRQTSGNPVECVPLTLMPPQLSVDSLAEQNIRHFLQLLPIQTSLNSLILSKW
jgi:hypothetical protein